MVGLKVIFTIFIFQSLILCILNTPVDKKPPPVGPHSNPECDNEEEGHESPMGQGPRDPGPPCKKKPPPTTEKPAQPPPVGPHNPDDDCEEGPDLPVHARKPGEPLPPPGRPCHRREHASDVSHQHNATHLTELSIDANNTHHESTHRQSPPVGPARNDCVNGLAPDRVVLKPGEKAPPVGPPCPLPGPQKVDKHHNATLIDDEAGEANATKHDKGSFKHRASPPVGPQNPDCKDGLGPDLPVHSLKPGEKPSPVGPPCPRDGPTKSDHHKNATLPDEGILPDHHKNATEPDHHKSGTVPDEGIHPDHHKSGTVPDEGIHPDHHKSGTVPDEGINPTKNATKTASDHGHGKGSG